MRILAITNMYPTKDRPDLGAFVEQQITGLKNIGVEVEMVFADRRKVGMTVYRDLGKRVRDKLTAFKAELVHVMYGGVMAEIVTRSVRDRPTVVTFHGSDLLGETSAGPFRKFAGQLGVWASRKSARRADGIIVVANALTKTLYSTTSKIKVIPCGIDIHRFKPIDRELCRKQLQWDPKAFHVVFPANTDNPVKRPELAQAAVRELIARGVRAEIHYLKGVHNAEVPIWINASDSLLLTSLHEGSPTIVKEALACNVPVVSVDVGDVRERIENIKGCYIANPDQESLAKALMLVYSGLRRIEGRKEVESFAIEQIAGRLKNFYMEITR